MNILSIFVVIIFYFFIKYLFRIFSFIVIMKVMKELQIKMRQSHIKGGKK
jgi:hypothetical protein